MTIPKFKKINIEAYKPGKSGINKNRNYIKLSANESSLGISQGVKKLFKNSNQYMKSEFISGQVLLQTLVEFDNVL